MIKAETSTPKASGKVGKGKKVPPKAKSSGTKLSQLEALLRRPEGASIAQLSTALAWQPHSVRGAMSGSLAVRRDQTKKAKGALVAQMSPTEVSSAEKQALQFSAQ